MIIYINNNITYNYIHIPKNSGKYIRKLIEQNHKNKVIKIFWGIKDNFDLAHIPYMLYKKYYDNICIFYTYVRNPYDRIISAYFYLNNNKNIEDFKVFLTKDLQLFNFDLTFNSKYIHYYPQYLFICDINYNINNVYIKKLEDNLSPLNSETDFFNHKLNSKKYELKKYLDDDCLKIINLVYKEDFLKLDYKMIDTI